MVNPIGPDHVPHFHHTKSAGLPKAVLETHLRDIIQKLKSSTISDHDLKSELTKVFAESKKTKEVQSLSSTDRQLIITHFKETWRSQGPLAALEMLERSLHNLK